MNKKCFIMMFLFAFCTVQPALAASQTAKLPDFTVRLNGVETMSNELNEYPLLVYQNVTYFPIT